MTPQIGHFFANIIEQKAREVPLLASKVQQNGVQRLTNPGRLQVLLSARRNRANCATLKAGLMHFAYFASKTIVRRQASGMLKRGEMITISDAKPCMTGTEAKARRYAVS